MTPMLSVEAVQLKLIWLEETETMLRVGLEGAIMSGAGPADERVTKEKSPETVRLALTSLERRR